MRTAIETGPDAVEKLPAPTVYMWLSKLFYGILYRENLLQANRRGGRRPIIPKKALQQLRLHHDFMQGIRRTVDFPSGIPGSVFIFGTTQPDCIEAQFDFLDNLQNRSIALRVGPVGIVCCLQDGGQTRELHDRLKMPYYRKNRLHPTQFRKVTAEIFYKSMLLESAPLYKAMEDANRMLVITQNRHASVSEIGICLASANFWRITGVSRWRNFMTATRDGRHRSATSRNNSENSTRMCNIACSHPASGSRIKTLQGFHDVVV